jgi:L-ascorbate metabolism protein UlaG (beta-lactamase superfamily)
MLVGPAQPRIAGDVKVKRLSWAGVQLEAGGSRVVIDLFAEAEHVRPFMGEPAHPLVRVDDNSVQLALVTHVHPDHYDLGALSASLRPDGEVACPPALATRVEETGLRARPVEINQTVSFGEYTVTAVPAVDGLGEEQVSWAVEADGRRIFHGGDTMWHGHWWKIARQLGPVDLAFLPINGALVQFPGLDPSGIPSSLTPEQAAAAGKLLGAAVTCPMHYGLFENPPVYVDSPDVEAAFLAASAARGLQVWLAKPGEIFDWAKD